MSDAKPFATVCEFDENVWIVDSPNEHRSSDVYAVCGKDKAEAERIASVINAAVARERREAAAEALEGIENCEALLEDGHGMVISKHAVRMLLRDAAAALRKGDG